MHTTVWMLSAAVGLAVLVGCGSVESSVAPGYYFSNPLLNDQGRTWVLASPVSKPAKKAAKHYAKKKTKKMSTKSVAKSKPAKATSGGQTSLATLQKKIKSKGPAVVTTTGYAATPQKVVASPGVGSVDRKSMVASAQQLLGIKDSFTQATFLGHILEANDIKMKYSSGSTTLQDFYLMLRKEKRAYDSLTPKPGDLVFFHNTVDVNGDGKPNDWYTMWGVVEKVHDNKNIQFIALFDGKVRRLLMNLTKPTARRDEATNRVLNSYLKKKSMKDPAYTQYLAGELFAGFGDVLD